MNYEAWTLDMFAQYEEVNAGDWMAEINAELAAEEAAAELVEVVNSNIPTDEEMEAMSRTL